MKLFKKALVASAVVASFGASAATVTPSTSAIKLSAEGVAGGVVADFAGGFDFNVTTGAETPANATVTITLSPAIDIGPIKGGITNTVNNGAVPGKGDAGTIDFDYGNGSFTFDNVTFVDNDQTKGESDTISFDISLGQPLAKNAAFNVAFGAGATIGGAATADYVAVHGGNTIDSGTGTVATEHTQFTVAVKTPLDKVINRTTPTAYTDSTDSDVLALSITNYNDLDMSVTVNAALNAAYDAVVSGDFTGVVNAEITNTPAGGTATHNVNGGADFIAFDLDDGTTPTTDGKADTFTVTFDHNGTAIPATGDVTLDFTVNSTDFGAAALNKKAIATKMAAGEWEVDATIINVPYFPVGFEGTSSQINLSNEKATAVDVIVSAFDQAGNTYAAVDLGYDLPAKTVTKISQNDLMTLLGVPAESKISVTFNIDANEGDVNGYAFTSSSVGRTEISTSQQRGN